MTREILKVKTESEFNRLYEEKIHNVLEKRKAQISSKMMREDPELYNKTHDWMINLEAMYQLMDEEKLPLIIIDSPFKK